jgi:regulator of protease activity HflC (stomatin/prohibitin superfamily)
MLAIAIVILVLLALAVGASIRIAKDYERGVVFRLGRVIGLKGPGLFLILPGIVRGDDAEGGHAGQAGDVGQRGRARQ